MLIVIVIDQSSSSMINNFSRIGAERKFPFIQAEDLLPNPLANSMYIQNPRVWLRLNLTSHSIIDKEIHREKTTSASRCFVNPSLES